MAKRLLSATTAGHGAALAGLLTAGAGWAAPPVWPGMQPQWPQQQWQQPAVNAAPHLVRWPCSSCFPVVLLLHTLLCKCWMCFKLW